MSLRNAFLTSIEAAIMVALGVAVVASQAIAGDIQLTVATDKSAYLIGEDITVSITAYNPNDYEETLSFSSSRQASYIMDNEYDWASEKVFMDSLTYVTIPPGSSYSWDLEHDWETTYRQDTYGYDLSIGTHTVVGSVNTTTFSHGGVDRFHYLSQPVEFEVADVVAAPSAPVPGDPAIANAIPEPGTLSLAVVLLAGLAIRRRR